MMLLLFILLPTIFFSAKHAIKQYDKDMDKANEKVCDIKCPKCGHRELEVIKVERKYGIIDLFISFSYNIFALAFRLIAAFCIIYIDLIAYLFNRLLGKGYFWKSKKLISNKKTIYRCNNCGKEIID